jgi:hypothetical protein
MAPGTSSRLRDRRGAEVARRRRLRHRGEGRLPGAGEGNLVAAPLAGAEVSLDGGALAFGERAVDVFRE